MTASNAQDRTARIRDLNDQLRRNFASAPSKIIGTAKVLLTPGLRGLSDTDLAKVVAAVTSFDAFTPDNDPHGEHDFGAIDIAGQRYFFKIDYYDETLTHGAPDPADARATVRVLTIMRADEY